MNQDSLAPSVKMSATGAAGALTTIALYVLSSRGIHVPAEVAAAITILIAFAAGYLVQERAPKQ